ncbi:MAG TPA: MCP four helix bundle domain-containing protein, partial [Bacillota bacterium]|nr:MCP four helix bundle domain-containing protein [Bacillota bacterium]
MKKSKSSVPKRRFTWFRNLKFLQGLGFLKRIIPVRFFGNLKISSKLILGFLIVALIAGAIGLIGIYNIHLINRAEQEVYQKNVALLGPLERISFYFLSVQANTGKHILDPNTKFLHESVIKTAEASIDLLVADLQKNGSADATVKSNLDSLKVAFESFWKEEEL